MFGRTPREPRTLGDLIVQRKRLVFTCMACKTITNINPSELPYKPHMELHLLDEISVCPECCAGNVPSEAKQLFLTIES